MHKKTYTTTYLNVTGWGAYIESSLGLNPNQRICPPGLSVTAVLVVGVYGSSSLSSICFRRLRQHSNRSKASNTPKTPATTPPAIAPTFVCDVELSSELESESSDVESLRVDVLVGKEPSVYSDAVPENKEVGEDEFEPEADVLPDEPEDALVVLELGRPVDDVPEEVFPLEDDEPPVAVLDGDEEDEVEVRVVAA